MSGHFWAASSVPIARFRLRADTSLRWFAASPIAERGFCADCGAFLFWKPGARDQISFAAGALDGATGLTIESDWFAVDAADYYTASIPAETLSGTCLCRANRFSARGPATEVTACHCAQCRKLSGHYSASFDIPEAALLWSTRRIHEHITPGGAQRGFCPTCGCKLYFRAANGDFSVEAGIIDGPTGARLTSHIFTADKGDYYDIPDGLPQSGAD